MWETRDGILEDFANANYDCGVWACGGMTVLNLEVASGSRGVTLKNHNGLTPAL